MRNKRLTISALALFLMAGCGQDRGLDPNLVALVGTWETASWVWTSEADPTLSEDAIGAMGTPGALVEAQFYFYNEGTLLTIVTLEGPLCHPDDPTPPCDVSPENPDHEVGTFEVLATGDVLDGIIDADIILLVAAGCTAAITVNADGDSVVPCNLILFDKTEADQITFPFTLNGENLIITGLDMYDFGLGADFEPANFVLEMDRIIPDEPTQSLT